MQEISNLLNLLVADPVTAIVLSIYALVFILLIFSKTFRKAFLRPLYNFARLFAAALTAFVGLKPADQELDQNSAYLQEILNAIRNRPSEAVALSADAEAEIISLFRTALEGTFGGDIRQEIRLLVRQQLEREVEHEASKFLVEVKTRLQAASSTVTVRGFVNLVFGIGFAAWALYLLNEAVDAFSPSQLSSVTSSVALYLIGIRVSLALLITVISYFFLSLYRRSLDEAKYYQNELTNISVTAAALQLSYYVQDDAIRTSVITKLMSTDRNADVSAAASPVGTESSADHLIKALVDKLPSLKVT